MSNLKGFVLQANQGLIHKDISIFEVVFTHRISDAYYALIIGIAVGG